MPVEAAIAESSFLFSRQQARRPPTLWSALHRSSNLETSFGLDLQHRQPRVEDTYHRPDASKYHVMVLDSGPHRPHSCCLCCSCFLPNNDAPPVMAKLGDELAPSSGMST